MSPRSISLAALGGVLVWLGIAVCRSFVPADGAAARQELDRAAVSVEAALEAPSGSYVTAVAAGQEPLVLTEQNPAAAAARLHGLPPALRVQHAAAVASAWAKTEPEIAANWARNLPEDEGRSEALFSLSADWATANPLAAAQCGLADLAESRQGEFLEVVGDKWSRQNPAAALAWIERQPDGLARQRFLAGVSSALAETAPEQAAQLVASLSDGPLQQETALTVVMEWARLDSTSAAEWVKLFPAGDLRRQALNNLVSLWAELPTESSPLLCWPEGQERDAAIRRYLDEVLETQPARGVEVLSAISDDAVRSEEVQRLAQHWMMQNPAEACEWLAREQIPFSVAH